MSKRTYLPSPDADVIVAKHARIEPAGGFQWSELLPELRGETRHYLSYLDAFVLSLTCKDEQRAFAPTKRATEHTHYIRLFDALMAGGTVAQAKCLCRLQRATFRRVTATGIVRPEYVSDITWFYGKRAITAHDHTQRVAILPPLLLAVDNNNVALLKWCGENTLFFDDIPLHTLARYAASRGCLPVLDWYRTTHSYAGAHEVSKIAALHGNVATMAWLRVHHQEITYGTRGKYIYLLQHAVYFGTLAVLDEMCRRGICPPRDPALFDDISSMDDIDAFYAKQDRNIFGYPRSATGPPVDLDRSRVVVAEWLAAKLIDPRVHPAYRRARENHQARGFAQMLMEKPALAKRYLMSAPTITRACATCKHRHRCRQQPAPRDPVPSSSSSDEEEEEPDSDSDS